LLLRLKETFLNHLLADRHAARGAMYPSTRDRATCFNVTAIPFVSKSTAMLVFPSTLNDTGSVRMTTPMWAALLSVP